MARRQSAEKRRTSSRSSSSGKLACDYCGGRFKYQPDRFLLSACPCPYCGLHVPASVRRARTIRHVLLALCSFPVLSAIIPGVALHRMSISTASLWGGLVAVAILVGHLWIALWTADRNPAANLKRAERGIDRQRLKKLSKQSPQPGEAIRWQPLIARQWIVISVMVLGVCGVLFPSVLRRIGGYVSNPGISPDVVGPGDEFVVRMTPRDFARPGSDGPRVLTSLGGLWQGRGSARIRLSRYGYTQAGLNVRSHFNEFRDGMEVSIREEGIEPWMAVRIPDRADLAWREVDLLLTLSVRTPNMRGWKSEEENTIWFNESGARATRRTTLVFSSPGAGKRYQQAWLFAAVPGLILLVVGGYAMARCQSLVVSRTHSESDEG